MGSGVMGKGESCGGAVPPIFKFSSAVPPDRRQVSLRRVNCENLEEIRSRGPGVMGGRLKLQGCGCPNFQTPKRPACRLIDVCIVLSHFNSVWNPALYAWGVREFRAALRHLVCCASGNGGADLPNAQTA